MEGRSGNNGESLISTDEPPLERTVTQTEEMGVMEKKSVKTLLSKVPQRMRGVFSTTKNAEAQTVTIDPSVGRHVLDGHASSVSTGRRTESEQSVTPEFLHELVYIARQKDPVLKKNMIGCARRTFGLESDDQYCEMLLLLQHRQSAKKHPDLWLYDFARHELERITSGETVQKQTSIVRKGIDRVVSLLPSRNS